MVPEHVQAALRRAQGGQASPEDIQLLRGYLVYGGPVAPGMGDLIDAALAQPQAAMPQITGGEPLTPPGAETGGPVGGPLGDWLSEQWHGGAEERQPILDVLSGTEPARQITVEPISTGARVQANQRRAQLGTGATDWTQEADAITGGEPFAPFAAASAAQPDAFSPPTNFSSALNEAQQRRLGRTERQQAFDDLAPSRRGNQVNSETMGGAGGEQTDWQSELSQFTEDPLGPESAFGAIGGSSGYGPELLGLMAGHPGLASKQLTKKYGGGDMSSALFEPLVGGVMGLARAGDLQGGRAPSLERAPRSAAHALQQGEAMMEELRASAPGTQMNPQALYQRGLRRALKTPTEAMAGVEGEAAGGPLNQIKATNEAMMTAAPFMLPEAYDALNNRLDRAAQEWLLAFANGTETRSYPEFLRAKGARKWL